MMLRLQFQRIGRERTDDSILLLFKLELIAQGNGEAAVVSCRIFFGIIHTSETEIVAGIEGDVLVFVGEADGDTEDYALADVRTFNTPFRNINSKVSIIRIFNIVVRICNFDAYISCSSAYIAAR